MIYKVFDKVLVYIYIQCSFMIIFKTSDFRIRHGSLKLGFSWVCKLERLQESKCLFKQLNKNIKKHLKIFLLKEQLWNWLAKPHLKLLTFVFTLFFIQSISQLCFLGWCRIA